VKEVIAPQYVAILGTPSIAQSGRGQRVPPARFGAHRVCTSRRYASYTGAVVSSLAVGMAAPYVVLSLAPGLLRYLPRPRA
jgi:hypothetical protein